MFVACQSAQPVLLLALQVKYKLNPLQVEQLTTNKGCHYRPRELQLQLPLLTDDAALPCQIADE